MIEYWKAVKLTTILTGTAFAAQTAGELGSMAEHSDILAKAFIALAGVAYTISTIVLAWIINRILTFDTRLTRLETRCEDNHE